MVGADHFTALVAPEIGVIGTVQVALRAVVQRPSALQSPALRLARLPLLLAAIESCTELHLPALLSALLPRQLAAKSIASSVLFLELFQD